MAAALKLLGLRGSIALALAIALAGVMWRADAISADRDRWEGASRTLAGRVLEERLAHRKTKFAYRLAQAQAAKLEAQRIERVKIEQQEITDDVTKAYSFRLADARARAERLRGEIGRAGKHPTGAAGGEPVPGTGAAAGRADEAPADPGLPAPSVDELAWRLVATEQAIQLDELINWVERQAAVAVNAPLRTGSAR